MADLTEQLSENISGAPTAEKNARSAVKSRRRSYFVVACVVILVASAAGYWQWSRLSGLRLAQKAMARGLWSEARVHMKEYLGYFPDSPEANLMMAEVIVKEDLGDPRDSVERAIEHLQKIGADSPLKAKATLQEARLVFLILRQPARAERLLQESLRLVPDSFEANFLMWKLLDLTDRHIESRDYFWRVYELSAGQDRVQRLRDWFLSEFFPVTANEEFTAVFGAMEIGKIPACVNLWVRLRENEPQASFLHAALANYYRENGRPKSSLELLKESPDLPSAMKDPYYVTVLFETLVDLGEFDKAKSCFAQFPQPHSGYLYWRSEGLFRQQILNDAASAVDSYQLALTSWPAKFDWGMMMRLSECLRKTDRSDDAQVIQTRVSFLTTEVLTKEKMSQLRERLRDLKSPAVARDVRDLYQEFGLNEEAAAWEEHRERLVRFPGTI